MTIGTTHTTTQARYHFADILDSAGKGRPEVVARDVPVALLDRASLLDLLESRAPFKVEASVAGNQLAFWLDGVGVHAVGTSLEEAEENFLDALLDYADLWFSDLRFAPNHRDHEYLAKRIALLASDRKLLASAVFGDE